MKIDLRPKVKPWRGEAFEFVEEKLDGHRVTIVHDESGIRAIGRKENINLWPKLNIPQSIPSGSMLDGELLAPGGHSTDVPTAINDGTAIFRPFAAPFWSGDDWRGHSLEFVRSMLTNMGFRVPDLYSRSDCQNRTEAIELARQQGWEGVVFKRLHYRDWYKIKPVRSVDCVVTDWEMGNGKFIGLLGAIHIAVYNESGDLVNLGRVGSGFNDRDRIPYKSSNRTKVVGRVAEVAYDSIAAKGKLRFPRFLRWRDDKPAEDCKKDQVI